MKAYEEISNDSLTLIPLCNGHSESYQLVKNYSTGRQWAEKALSIATRFKNQKEKSRALKNLGSSLSGQGQKEEAEAYFNQALEQLPKKELDMDRIKLEILNARLKNRFRGDDQAVYGAFRETFDTVFNHQKANAIENARI